MTGKNRKTRRLIDTITCEGYEENSIPSEHVEELTELWPALEDKGWELYEKIEQHDQAEYEAAIEKILAREGQTRAWLYFQLFQKHRTLEEMLGENPFTEPSADLMTLHVREVAALFRVAASLMAPLTTDSSRRESRDSVLARDFILHSEMLNQPHVMKNVCRRWNLSKSAVEQAVREHGETARQRLVQQQSEWAEHGRQAALAHMTAALKYCEPSDPRSLRVQKFFEATPESEFTFERYESFDMENMAAEYIAGKIPDWVPRKRK